MIDKAYIISTMPYGWRAITDNMLNELITIIADDNLADFKILDCKEKYGTGRLYTNYMTDKIDKVITNWENATANTCVNCGKAATQLSKGYILPFCDNCFVERGA